ncbi:hypothetical protein AALP_AA8G492300 [Arabis alpina]|uniref:Nucleoplasmin-like domain-containing protein n=1 Tax=Arabis alpina TaxID=50452 RepID=A0A087GEF0_ARAAL|nr:hypothetical protein AALP_AA8G492300 [Arabis alpina]
MSMEFWGAKVQSKKGLNVNLRQRELVHLSHVSLDLGCYNDDRAIIQLEVGGKGKFVIGSLSKQKTVSMSVDLIVDESFRLSHSLNKGSVHFVGYKTSNLKNATAEDKVNLVSEGNKGKNNKGKKRKREQE